MTAVGVAEVDDAGEAPGGWVNEDVFRAGIGVQGHGLGAYGQAVDLPFCQLPDVEVASPGVVAVKCLGQPGEGIAESLWQVGGLSSPGSSSLTRSRD